MKKFLFILCLLTPFLMWNFDKDICRFSINGEQWELSPPYSFDIGNVPEGEHKIRIEYVDFWLIKYKARENKKFKWEVYDLDYAPEDADKFNDNLPYIEKIKK